MLIASEEGICNFAIKSKDIRFYTTNEGLLHNNALHLFFDSKKRLWISSHGSPPYYLSNGKDTALKDIEDLVTFNVNAISEDQNGNIWIATEGDGVFKYNGKKVTNYKMTDGLCSNYCYGIEVDKNNCIWVTHKNGLSEKKPLKEDFSPITQSEGLLFVENNLNAVYKDRNGDLWFGTTEGIVHYNSEIGRNSNAEPKLSILDVKIDGKSYSPTKPIELPYGFHSVHIDFLAISLTNPEKIKYKFRLMGIDSTWKIASSSTPFMDYPALTNGSYKFQLIACNSEGLWTRKPVEIEFTIREPIWKKVWFYLLLIAGVVSVTYFIIVWRTANLKRSQMLFQTKVKQKTFLLQREKEEVEKIKVELEVKNKDITDSINYAKRIQDSLLPPDELLSELFDENHFIFYRPKDIVSGDFYWAAKVETGVDKSRKLSLAAVADCTGHGVPGAFLSIVANSFLKQSLTEKFVTNTGEVLDYLNYNITSTLNQSSKIKNRIRDGMDLAIIAIDYKAHKLFYSGANNSLYIFRKTDDDTELFVLKPTKQAIGSVSENLQNYQSQEFDIVAGDTIYMFTDGYPDQFGGDRDKKLNYKRFKEILSAASDMPMSLQRSYLEDCFEDWKGKTPQTDDVCVMAIKI
jgi:serine phosphatase RsbU (regulator of sigma subunit)